MSDETGPMIDRYLDNLMSPQERADFEGRLSFEPALAAELRQQRELDAAIRRVMPVPQEAAARAMLTQVLSSDSVLASPSKDLAGRIGPRRTAPVTRWLAAAAIIAISIGAGWFAWQQLKPPDLTVVAHAPMPPADYYRMKVNSGFKPSWTCKDDAEFARSFNTQFGQPLLPKALPAGIAVGGIDYCNTLTPRTIGLLSSVDDQKVIVLVDKIGNDKPLNVPAESGLHLFRRQLGELVAYEVTPFDKSIVLELLYVPETLPAAPPSPSADNPIQSG